MFLLGFLDHAGMLFLSREMIRANNYFTGTKMPLLTTHGTRIAVAYKQTFIFYFVSVYIMTWLDRVFLLFGRIKASFQLNTKQQYETHTLPLSFKLTKHEIKKTNVLFYFYN